MNTGRWTPRGSRFRGRQSFYRARGSFSRGRGWPRREDHNDRNTDGGVNLDTIDDYYPAIPCPYKGWKLYFPQDSYRENHPFTDTVKIFGNYYLSHTHQYNIEDIENRKSFTVDIKKLFLDADIQAHTDQLKKELADTPEKLIACMGLAMHQHICIKKQDEFIALQNETDDDEEDEDDYDDPFSSNSAEDPTSCMLNNTIFARLVNVEPQVQMCDLKANCYGKLVSIKGTVVRVSDIKPYSTQMAFQCLTCSQIQAFPLVAGKYKMPTKCASRECRGRTFVPIPNSELTKTIDWQNIRIQEMNDARQDVGRVPRTVECELMYDLVDTCVPGDVVMVTGIVKVNNSSQGYQRNQQDKCLFLLYIEANSICNSRGTVSGQTNTPNVASTSSTTLPVSGIGMQFTLKELYAVQEIQAQKNLFHLIVNSLCPAIYGHEMVKAGLILGLFGGTQKFSNDKNRIPVRGDPHVLVVGDPGIGKSQMLQACANVSPRGVYICGHTTTTSGLTVTVTKDGSHDNSLEAGALVLSDQGCCCIDELDKMGTQQQALLEAMEQQCISIAKAGIVCSLPARASVLAAANPVGGHYNKAKTVSENLKIGAALLSRFDLVFILLDKPDEEIDSMLSEHVMALHAAVSNTRQSNRSNASVPSLARTPLIQSDSNHSESLSQQLKMKAGHHLDIIPHQLLSKYIGYARQYVHPKLTPAAAGVLREFYLELRRQHQTMDSTPITTRQLESLIRLSEARARLELREDVTESDARDVVEIMKHSMIDTYSDDFGVLDFRRSQHGSGMSSKSMAKKFISVLTQRAERTNQSLFTMQQMRDIMKDFDLHVPDFEGFIDSLNNHGYLLKKGPRLFQLHTV